MNGFDDARAEFRRARAELSAIRHRLRLAVEAKNRLERRIASRRRGANEASGSDPRGEIEALTTELRGMATVIETLRAGLEAAAEREHAVDDRFEPFTDPMVAVEGVPDTHPFLLFPFRIETRFGTADDGSRQLWVRVFPDDVIIDAFDPVVAEAERTNTTLYWTNIWRAGGVDAERRAAWASLARSHGIGRARWLLDQFAPLNPAAEPVRGDGDHILVIAPEQPVPDTEKPAISAYWAASWQAAAADVAVARADLDAALGSARAAEVVATLTPTNFHDVAVKRTADLNVVVAYLDLPGDDVVTTRQLTWSQAARAWLLPERFVLMGFSGRDRSLVEVGKRIPSELQVGPDPTQDPGDALAPDGHDLAIPEAMAWTVDFDRAVEVGMGFRVGLTDAQAATGFDRLFVLGARLAADAADGADELETLITHHQASRKGFSLLPQGRPTNNTDRATSGYTWWEDPDEAYDHFFVQDPTDDPAAWHLRSDGRWLAGLLGVDREILKRSPHYFGKDLAEARAMNIALWPATLGYYLEHMLSPLVAGETINRTRAFFNRFVVGTGLAPAIRIGRQPYGILPTSALSRMRWTIPKEGDRNRDAPFLAALQGLVDAAAERWTGLAEQVAHVGMATDDPQQSLLDVVGLHPASVEFHQRYAETFDELYNRLSYSLFSFHVDAYEVAREYVEGGLQVLADLGIGVPEPGMYPAILERFFLIGANLLGGDLVEPTPLSETAPLGVRRADGLNYLEWLAQAARTSHDALRRQEGFDDERPPAELLYLTLRHALDLGFVDTSIDLMARSDSVEPDEIAAVRTEPRFIHVDEPEADSGSRWQFLYRADEAITGDPDLLLGEFIPGALEPLDAYLGHQLAAVDRLAGATAAALERGFVAHLDACSYRLDAWRSGLLGARLAAMRRDSDGEVEGDEPNGVGRRGILIGGYGWLEDVRPKPATRTPVELDEELAAIFQLPDDPPLMRDSTNMGHIHAPSLDHAVTAAILRNGYLANATPDNPLALAVNLSSERVRTAMRMVEGIRNGQSLGALLGYQLERSLHDSDDLFLDRLVFELRRAFPLAGNRIAGTATGDGDIPITAVEARNVVDGLALVEHFDTAGVSTTYPYDLPGLPPLSDLATSTPLSPAELGGVIDAKVDAIRGMNDSVADLATAEGIFQVVKGNYDRASGTLEAFSKGHYPPTPDVAATPRSGSALTHRIALHLAAGLDPTDPVNTTPRSRGEPALNAWLAGLLPPMAAVFAAVDHIDPVTGAEGTETFSMADLGLLPIDLFTMLGSATDRAAPGLDELLIHEARRARPDLRDDTGFRPGYRPVIGTGFTVFEVAPVVRALRGLVLGSRPLRATDLMLANEASAGADASTTVRDDKVAAVLSTLSADTTELRALASTLETAVGDGVDQTVAEAAAVADLDQWTADYAEAVHRLRLFGLPAVDLTLAIDRARPHVASLAAIVDALAARWDDKLQRFGDILADYADLPLGTADDERFALLIRAGRTVSTSVVAPLPATPEDMFLHVETLRDDLAAALVDLGTLLDGSTHLGAMYSAALSFAPRVASFDQDPLDLAGYPAAMLSIARDLLRATTGGVADIDSRTAAAQANLDELPATEPARQPDLVAAAARALLGDSFIVLPEFTLAAPQLAEWENAWGDRLAILAHLQSGPEGTPFPVDDWLHQLARVRAKVGHAETAALLGEALGVAQELALTPLQFPYIANDVWLGGPFPETMPATGEPFRLEADHLLYTAHIAPGAEVDPSSPDATYCGILLDEWVEVIPGAEETTGLAFHFDRPSSEAPQALLLVTPPELTGSWRWDDLVDTLHDTLDAARLRAVEPGQIDVSTLAPFLPALLSSVTVYPITAALDYGFNNDLPDLLMEADFE